MKKINFLVLLGLMGVSTHSSQAQIASSHKNKLVWSDEFNYKGRPDSTKWTYEYGFIRNEEPQWYQPENAYCDGQNLIIEVEKKQIKNPQYDSASKDWRLNRQFAEYVSSCLISLGKFDFRYGRVEMRAKIPVQQGLWPAFWMLGVNRGPVPWPACGEVDIMEYYRGILHANAAWKGKNGSDWDAMKWKIADWGGEAWAKDFHTWVLDWDKDKMVISMDGLELNTIDLKQTINDGDGENPFHKSFYLLFNVALGQSKEVIPDENLPAKMIVDYVRVYQK